MTYAIYSDSTAGRDSGFFSTSGGVAVLESVSADASDGWVSASSSKISLAYHSELTMLALGGSVPTPAEMRRGIDQLLRAKVRSVPVRNRPR
jgi:hypothetical protein